MSVIFKCITGPDLYRVYRLLNMGSSKGEPYVGNALERYSSTVITSIHAALSVSLYASPLILSWLYRRDYFNAEGITYLGKCVCGITLIYFAAFYVRGFGRVFNPVYRQFIDVLAKASRSLTPENKALMSNYDFHFGAWPAEYLVSETGDIKFFKKTETKTAWERTKDFPKHVASWLMLHSFGIKLIYPGSIQLLQASISAHLQDGRAQLVTEKGGQRYKVVTSDKNDIDCMFFDRRNQKGEEGSTLVISCDGNAGFYEIGVLSTPLDKGYSVLGWNHPGFGGSTGTPYPQAEANAADAVMQFALNHLGFTPDQIILHGWSIGGFTVSNLAMTYPEVKGVVIDASFDQLLPLAVPRMPQLLEPLVSYAVRNFVSLNIAEQLKQYPGPIRVIRRSMDEMVTTDMTSLISNRGNNLLMEILRHRYPRLLEDKDVNKTLWDFLALDETGQSEKIMALKIDEKDFIDQLSPREFPSKLGDTDKTLTKEEKVKMVLFLARHHLEEVDSTHCSPLPRDKFNLPSF